jgi:hypothetical protein
LKPWLCKAGVQLREQIDDWFPDRDRASDGFYGDARHALTKSDHNPDATSKPPGVIRAFDCDADLSKQKGLSVYLADQIRQCGKTDPRIAYVIHHGQIASSKRGWAWRDYKGINRHDHHIHVSFTKLGDQDNTYFQIPLIGGKI